MAIKQLKSELAASTALVVILLSLLLPTGLLMPQSLSMMLPLALIVMFFVYAVFFFKEGFADEREDLHRLQAGRISFLSGSSVLTLGILLQSLNHEVDPWLVYTLVAMILAKIAARIYSQNKN